MGRRGPLRTSRRGARLRLLALRRFAGTFLLFLFVAADPAYSCPINCILNDHAEEAERHPAGVGLRRDMCHAGPQVTPRVAPVDRDTSPTRPSDLDLSLPAATERPLPLPEPAGGSRGSSPAPPSPPPRA